MKSIIILGSSRSDGNTAKMCQYVSQKYSIPCLDLSDYEFSYFDYEHQNREDDFLKLIKKIADYDTLIFASPIYWYSMSGIMKVFFDRITDLLLFEKKLGRNLRGKQMGLISCSSDDEPVGCFYKPFILSADYLGMNYIGHVHGSFEENQMNTNVEQRLDQYIKTIP